MKKKEEKKIFKLTQIKSCQFPKKKKKKNQLWQVETQWTNYGNLDYRNKKHAHVSHISRQHGKNQIPFLNPNSRY